MSYHCCGKAYHENVYSFKDNEKPSLKWKLSNNKWCLSSHCQDDAYHDYSKALYYSGKH